MKTYEKYKAFAETYQDYLQEHGYFRKGKVFYRVNLKNQFISVVEMILSQFGFINSVDFVMHPFTRALKIERLGACYPLGGYVRHFTGKYCDFGGDVFEEQLPVSFELFKKYEIVQKMEEIQTLDQFLVYEEHLQEQCYMQGVDALSRAWDFIALKRYQGATSVFLTVIERRQRWLESEGQKPYLAEKAQQTRAGVAQIKEILHKIETGEYDTLQAEVQNRIGVTIQSCNDFFGKMLIRWS